MDCKRKNIVRRWGILAVALLGIFILSWATAKGAEVKNQATPEITPELPIPKSQFFCGNCHILVYPDIIQKQYELWKKSKHNKVGCRDCHFGPGNSKPMGKVSTAGHLPKKAPERFTFLEVGGSIVQTCAKIDNATCMTADCHGKPGDDFKTKKIKYTEKVTYVHQPHFEDKNQIKGQKLNCTNCHQAETNLKKFEVSKGTCHLCHFMGTKLNEGRSRCEICHKLPEGPIKASTQETVALEGSDRPTSETKPPEPKHITHAMLKEAGVSCISCHFDLVRSSTGASYEAFFEKDVLKTAVVYGVGRIKKENCRTCHDKEKDLKEAMTMELMHQRHVTTKNARCLDCHQRVTHTKAELADRMPEDDDPVLLTGCMTCHPTPHYYQRVLTSGFKNPAYDPAPNHMYSARVNCLGCHNKKTTLSKGQTVLKASEKTCVSCHDKKYEKILKDWKAELNDKIKSVSKTEKQILNTLNAAKTKLSEDQLHNIMEKLARAQENFKIVQFGKGAHNKSYALLLLDESIERFKELQRELANIQK